MIGLSLSCEWFIPRCGGIITLLTPEWDTIIQEFCKIKKAKSWTIVITTRQKDIAEHCCKKLECIHRLNILGAEEARELFIKTVMKKTHIQSNSFDIMLCISTTVLKLASKRYSLEYFVGKNMKSGKTSGVFLCAYLLCCIVYHDLLSDKKL